MKMLLDGTVYELPSDLVTTWVRITPQFRDQVLALWTCFCRGKGIKKIPQRYQVDGKLGDEFIGLHKEAYYQILFEAMLDCKATMGEDFEDYAIDMSADDLASYAAERGIEAHSPA